MIDFRYHLVSLISVFLALAVGIILGAGPLQGTIGDQLTDQVDSLRTERNDLRDSLARSQADADERLEFIEAAGPSLLEGTLVGRSVAVVDLDGVSDDIMEDVTAGIEAAGGSVSARLALTEAWADDDHEGFRETVAAGMRPRLRSIEEGLSEDASTEELLGTALALALAHESEPGTRSDDAQALQQQLVQADLIVVDGDLTAAADAVLLVSGTAGSGAPQSATPAPSEATAVSMATLAGAVQAVAPTVVAGPTTTSGDVVSTVRGDSDVAERVSTVSGVDKPVGQIAAPLAVAAQLAGTTGHYGFEDGTTPLPRVVRPRADTGLGADAGSDSAGADGQTDDDTGDVTQPGGGAGSEGGNG
ncbi:copper transporter [Xylanimonas ulmi]|uniref:Copper transport outer membrane protein MctB n=1 Tax=Xylanimonas ulmi TaxID=228973 RepID=A0A4Q7M3N2_9MICO|nr:copper transporter [Xylanibacterium ulmi]RZS61232.1 copper transport outer membrane protein MctB [Xylanibacterium ulmi]